MVSGPVRGTYAQRLDSVGTRLWGDAGIFVSPHDEGAVSISLDGIGGLFVSQVDTNGDIRAYHLDGSGNHLWSEQGVLVCQMPTPTGLPKITQDGNGGAYIIWNDCRPPYGYWDGAIFMQKLDEDGNPEWDLNGEFIYDDPAFYDVIPDGEGGFILHCGSGGFNYIYRITPDGTTLWTRDHVSWLPYAMIVEGEPGFFYLGFTYYWTMWGQRMDMEGNIYWPTYGSGRYGAPMIYMDGYPGGGQHFAYQYPYFYGVRDFITPGGFPRCKKVAILDSLGNANFGIEGIMLTYTRENSGSVAGTMVNTSIVPDEEGGIVAVWEQSNGSLIHDIYAKHCNADGSLGGPDPRVRPDVIYPQISGTANGTVRFTLPEAGRVELDLYNLLGRKVGVIGEAYYSSGSHTAVYDLRHLTSGVYFVRLKADYGQVVKKVVVVR